MSATILIDSPTWWKQTKENPERFMHWLKKQYHGEITAHARIVEFVDRYIPQDNRWRKVILKIASQELTHAQWVAQLLSVRGITPEVLDKEERYWNKTLPSIQSLHDGAAVAAHAEGMRLERIRVIVQDPETPKDVRDVFTRILPEEEFHERAFRKLAGAPALSQALENHLAGREAIGLIPEGFTH